MRERRGGRADHELCSGPGKLTEALGIGLEHNGADLGRDPFLLLPRRAGAGARRGRHRPPDRDHQGGRAALALLRRGQPLRLAPAAAASPAGASRGAACRRRSPPPAPRGRLPARLRGRRRRAPLRAPALRVRVPARRFGRGFGAGSTAPASVPSGGDVGARRRAGVDVVAVVARPPSRVACFGAAFGLDLLPGGHHAGPDQRREGAAVHRAAAVLGRHRRRRVGVADPDAGGDFVGDAAAEPGVAVVLGRPGLAPLAFGSPMLAWTPVPPVTTVVEDRLRLFGDRALVDHLVVDRVVVAALDRVAVLVGDLGVGDRAVAGHAAPGCR